MLWWIREAFFLAGRLAMACALAAFAGVLSPLSAEDRAAPPRVVAANTIVADWVREVAGGRVQLEVLASGGADVHTFDPAPSDLVALSRADLVFAIGLGHEHWLDRAYRASRSKAVRVPLGEGLELIHPGDTWALRDVLAPCCAAAAEATLAAAAGGAKGLTSAAPAGDRAGSLRPLLETITPPGMRSTQGTGTGAVSEKGSPDPHVWLDVRNAISMVVQINEVLAEADPAQAAAYDAAAGDYIKRLRKLDEEVAELVMTIPPERRILVAGHDALAYFARRYGFARPASVIAHTSTDHAGPTAKHLVALREFVRDYRVAALFSEDDQPSRALLGVARESGLPIGRLHIGGTGKPGGPAGTYLGLMRHNVRTIASLLAAETGGAAGASAGGSGG